MPIAPDADGGELRLLASFEGWTSSRGDVCPSCYRGGTWQARYNGRQKRRRWRRYLRATAAGVGDPLEIRETEYRDLKHLGMLSGAPWSGTAVLTPEETWPAWCRILFGAGSSDQDED